MPYPAGHRTEVRKKIVDSARRLFNRHGFDNVSGCWPYVGANFRSGEISLGRRRSRRLRLQHIGRAEALRDLERRALAIDGDDPLASGKDRALHDVQSDAAGACMASPPAARGAPGSHPLHASV